MRESVMLGPKSATGGMITMTKINVKRNTLASAIPGIMIFSPRLISSTAVIETKRAKTEEKNTAMVPPKSCIATFDDGNEDTAKAECE